MRATTTVDGFGDGVLKLENTRGNGKEIVALERGGRRHGGGTNAINCRDLRNTELTRRKVGWLERASGGGRLDKLQAKASLTSIDVDPTPPPDRSEERKEAACGSRLGQIDDGEAVVHEAARRRVDKQDSACP
ncbi:hypothetical protein SCHPADRAFT_894300 [Schizopora paradoxa]|nr:hypothetical protein SCHPADRAFT_894300 [Schizopora paradoxa]